MRIFSYLLIVIIIVIGISFASLNANTVAFNYYIGHMNLPLALLLLMFFILGSFFTLFFNVMSYIKSRRIIKGYKKRLADAEKEIKNLRELPIKDQTF